MRFIGRQEEIRAINYSLSKPDYQGILIYGRRRIGKTALMIHCCENHFTHFIYFQCTADSEASNCDGLAHAISAALGMPALSFASFADGIDFVFSYAEKEETCLIIDEFPYLVKIVKGIDSKLQSIIDSHRNKSALKFFISGSSVSVMQELQGEGAPLYRRFQLSLFLKEHDYLEAAQYYPSFTDEDKVRLYSAFGGVPYYLSQIDSGFSVKDNIINLLSGRFARLENEATSNLKTELSKIDNANAVFSAIAQGYSRFGDILSQSHLTSSPLLSIVLDRLQAMDLVQKITPINDERGTAKALYRLSDNAYAFYYRYLFQNKSTQAVLSDEAFYENVVAEDFETKFVPLAFEGIAKQYLIRQNRQGLINPPYTAIGTYWYDDPKKKKNGQFDVVGKCKEGYDFYEVKFSKNPVDDALIQQEATQMKETGLPIHAIGFVSRSGFSLHGQYPYSLITLEEIYRDSMALIQNNIPVKSR